jgi:SAM-dependent methyltransferase
MEPLTAMAESTQPARHPSPGTGRRKTCGCSRSLRLGCAVVTDTPGPPRMRTVEEIYGSAMAEEEAFQAALDQSLAPRGFGVLFDLVDELGLPPGSAALDVGAREGHFCVELARRFGFTVHGIEPVRRHLENAARALDALAAAEPDIAVRIRIDQGIAERLPDPDASADLIWCRDVLEHVQDLEAAFGEFRRVLRPGGHAVIHASSVDPQHFEDSIAAAGLTITQAIPLHGEWRERLEEDGTGLSSRQLLWVSRLLRNRPAYEERFGADAYDAMLTDSLWGIYQMIGKLNPRLYVLSR